MDKTWKPIDGTIKLTESRETTLDKKQIKDRISSIDQEISMENEMIKRANDEIDSCNARITKLNAEKIEYQNMLKDLTTLEGIK